MPVVDLITVRDLGHKAISIADTQETLVNSPITEESSTESFATDEDSKLALSDIPEEGSDDDYETETQNETNSSTSRSKDSEKTMDSTGFRDSLRKSLQDMLRRSNGRPSSSRFSRKDRRRGSLKEKSSVDVELWREMTENILQDAASKELPPSDEEDLPEPEENLKVDDELHVSRGVILTEEDVESNSADLITSA